MTNALRAAAPLTLSVFAAFGASAQGSGTATLDVVRGRGMLVCGVSTGVAGFSLADSQGIIRGLDADGCRQAAAAVLGDLGKVRFVPLSTINRFTALQSGEIDVLFRGTTWILLREASLGLEFAGVNFYDGMSFMVKTSADVKSAKELAGATICVQPGTSTELAVSDYFRVNGMKFTPVLIQDVAEMQGAFVSGRCDAYSTDGSGLAAFRFSQGSKASDYVLLPGVISKEPLVPIVRKGDDKLFDIVRWTHIAGLAAEELGVTSKNVDSFTNSTNPDIPRLLGSEGDMGEALGLDNKWAYNSIKQVGNYGEIYDRNIGPLGLPRTLNKLGHKAACNTTRQSDEHLARCS